MSVPMKQLFDACHTVLHNAMCPLRYGILVEKALALLGMDMPHGLERRRVKEDVREKMLEAGQRGSFYVPSPLCYAGLLEWFLGKQRDLFNAQAYDLIIPAHASWSVDACTESHMRRPHMLTKVADCYQRWAGLSRGMLIQNHISQWFREQWPDQWRPPDNEGKWSSPCDHDFKLLLPAGYGGLSKVDAMGPRADGAFGFPQGGGKRPVDIHLAGSMREDHFILHGFIQGHQLCEDFGPDNTQSICRLVVILNCEKYGIDYETVKAAAINPGRISSAVRHAFP